MKSERTFKQLILIFGVVLLAYAAGYSGIEHLRNRKGPWQVGFAQLDGVPALVIYQPALAITNVQVVFPGDTTDQATEVVHFDRARPVPYDLPFGQCVFQDTTFLPGTIAMNVFGHEVQLMPRVLTIDGIEHSWSQGQVISVSSNGMPPGTGKPVEERSR